MAEPPPRPPPHGQNPRPPGGGEGGNGGGGGGARSGGLPNGNYDIFVIPPHSSGSGFLYLPSMQPHRNSFLLGVACTLLAVGLWSLVVPVLKHWLATVFASGGVGVLLLVLSVGVAGWAWGKTQAEGGAGGPGEPKDSAGANAGGSYWHDSQQHQYEYSAPPPPGTPGPEPPKAEPKPSPGAASSWEKAREETRKREEERKRAEDLRKKREEAQKQREDTERTAKAKAEKDKWEQARAREKEARERDARERIARERLAREKEARDKTGSAGDNKGGARSTPSSRYERPTARSAAGTEDEYSFRPYDTPPPPPPQKRSTPGGPSHAYKTSGSSSASGISESSYAPSLSTARTTPPPSHRGPYSTKDPDKIHIKAVYLFSDSFPLKPLAQLVSNQPPVTDGLVLRIKTEGLFIDDDIRGVPQREWDVKAWTLKLVEDGMTKAGVGGEGLHVVRATARDVENKRYTFVLDESEAWKVALGLQRLRKGSQVRALGMNGMKEGEVKALLGTLGWL